MRWMILAAGLCGLAVATTGCGSASVGETADPVADAQRRYLSEVAVLEKLEDEYNEVLDAQRDAFNQGLGYGDLLMDYSKMGNREGVEEAKEGQERSQELYDKWDKKAKGLWPTVDAQKKRVAEAKAAMGL